MKKYLGSLAKLFERLYILILIMTAALIMVDGMSLYIWPTFVDIRQQGTLDLSRAEQEEQKLQKHIEELQSLKISYENFSSQQIKRLREILPKEPDLPSLFVQVNDISEKNNMALASINIIQAAEQTSETFSQEPAEEGLENQNSEQPAFSPQEVFSDNNGLIAGIKELMVTVNISGGDYTDLKNFLSDIERDVRLFDVTSMNFASIEARQYLINMKTYYMP